MGHIRSSLFLLQAIVKVIEDTFNEKGECVTDGQATIGYELAKALCKLFRLQHGPFA